MADFETVMSSDFTLDDCPRIGPFGYHNMDMSEPGERAHLYGDGRLGPMPISRVTADPTVEASTKECIMNDPLDCSGHLLPAAPTWKLASACPVPRAIPNMKPKKGTTTLAFHFDGGVIMAVDSRASAGQYIASQTVMKVIEINDFLLGTVAGGAADCQYWERVLGMECRLWELRNESRITVAAASKILANITYNYRNQGLSMGTMLAGWDRFGPALYYVDDKGSRVKGELFSVGSGSVYAYGVLDTSYRKDMSLEEACDVARRAVFHATYRDAASGGIVTVYHIHKDGWTQISRDNQTALYDRYFPS